MSAENDKPSAMNQAELLFKNLDASEVVSTMFNQGYSLFDIHNAVRACGYMSTFHRDDEIKASTIVVSQKPIYFMLTGVGRAAMDSTRNSQSYPQEVALGELKANLSYLLENWDEVEHPSCISFTRHEE